MPVVLCLCEEYGIEGNHTIIFSTIFDSLEAAVTTMLCSNRATSCGTEPCIAGERRGVGEETFFARIASISRFTTWRYGLFVFVFQITVIGSSDRCKT